MRHRSYQDNPMIPSVVHRDKMEPYLEDIVSTLTFEIIKWETLTPLKKQAFDKLIKKGFQNDEFLWITQLACDYADYLLHSQNALENKVVTIACDKATALYLALLIQKTGQMSTVLPGAQNYFHTQLKEYPELMRKIKEHLSKYGNNLGANEMQIAPYQPFTGQDGQTYCYDNYGRMMSMQPPAPQTTAQEWQGFQQRRQMTAYRQQAPQMQQPVGYSTPQNATWGPNGAQPMAIQQQPVQQPLGPHGGAAGGFTGYSNNQQHQQQGGGGFGPYNPPLTAAQHQQAQGNQRHTDLPPPAAEGQQQPLPTARPGTLQNQQVVQPSQAPVQPVVEIAQPDPLAGLMKTHTGYECDYFTAQHPNNDLRPGLPIIFDSFQKKGIYQLSSDMKVMGFKTINYQESDVEYQVHETSSFFTRTRADAKKPNKQETRTMLAEIQRSMFVKEKLLDIELIELEGNVTGDLDEEVDLTAPIYIAKTQYGEAGELEYVARMLTATGGSADYLDRVVNYEHVTHTGIVFMGQAAKLAIQLRQCKDWIQLNEVLNSLLEEDLPLYQWKYFNDTTTRFINDVLQYRLNLDVVIGSFNIDIDELIAYLYKEHSVRNDFTLFVRELCSTWLFPMNLDQDDVKHFVDAIDLGEDDEVPEADSTVTFVTLTDVTTLPIESSSIYLPVPNNPHDDEAPVACVVTEESFPELFRAVHDRMTNANIRASQVVFVTRDNVVMYVKKTNSTAAYVLSHKQ